jgi:hypothetical protein
MTKIQKRIAADPRVEKIIDERDGGDGIWVYLNPGFHDGYDQLAPTHAIVEDTWEAVRQQMRCVAKCACKECR